MSEQEKKKTDMVLWRGSETIAVEVKVFTPPKMRSFYEGIGQALALHRYGFDYAALWLLFLNASDDDLRRGSTAWEFVRKLRLPLDFTFFKVEAVDGGIDNCRFRSMQYLDSQRSYELREIDDPKFNIHFDWLNPLAQECEQRVIRKALALWFDGTLSIERLRSEIGSCVDLSRAAQSQEVRVLLRPTNSTSSSGF
jgi:hypothetical protein